MKIYLAGSLNDDWRSLITDFETYDLHGIQEKSLNEIASIEMRWIKDCDGLLAWFPEDNPSGIGLAAELGFAKALGKLTVLVYPKLHKRVEWLRYIADFETNDIDEAIKYLKSQDK